MGDQNPWEVKNIEAFSFYCCPECDFKSKDGDHFKRHAIESHNKSILTLDALQKCSLFLSFVRFILLWVY